MMDKLKVIEFFAGIGSQHSALKRLGIDFEIVGIAEIDKYAIKSYEAIHGKVHNYGDISKIEKVDYADFWTYSFPCQDLSVAGKQKGLGEGTRSGLLYEVERLLDVAKENNELPKYLMLENVKNLVGKKFKGDFDRWIGKLNQLGYNTYWKVLNAKHYGVPQNRERVFAISIRKDVDMGYLFPEGFDNGVRLKDILEEEVDEKFYISNEKADKLLNRLTEECNPQVDEILWGGEQENQAVKTDGISTCLTSSMGQGGGYVPIVNHIPKKIGNIYGDDKGTGFAGNVWDKEFLSPTLTAMQGGNREPMIISVGNINPSGNGMSGNVHHENGIAATIVRGKGEGQKIAIEQATVKGYIECNVPDVFDMTYPDSKTRRGRVQDHGETVPALTDASQDIMYVEPSGVYLNQSEAFTRNTLKGISRTLKANQHDSGVIDQFRIRKLTPKECFRLMGFTDEEFHKAEKVNSNSQLYKQAGNSIVVDVLYYLFKNLFITDDEILKERQITIFDRLNEVE